MSERFDQLTERHRRLRLASEIQRRELGAIAEDIEVRLSGVDRAVNTVRAVARNPAVIIGAVAALAAIGPRRLLKFASRSAMAWATARQLLRRE